MPLPILPSTPERPTEPPAAVELAGSVLVRLARRGSWLVAVFAISSGSGSQEIEARLLAGEAHGDLAGLPCPVASATLRVAGDEVPGPLPLPFERPGAVELEIVDPQGGRALLVGARLELAA